MCCARSCEARKSARTLSGWVGSAVAKTKHFSLDIKVESEGFLAQMQMFPALGQGAVVMVNSIQAWSLRGELIQAIGLKINGLDPEAFQRQLP